MTQHGLRPFLVDVPACAPETREQWGEWCRYWPVAWRVPEQGPGEAAPRAPLTTAEQSYFEGQMAAALRIAAGDRVTTTASSMSTGIYIAEGPPVSVSAGLASDATRGHDEVRRCSRYCCGNAALIVDPVSGEVVGSSEPDIGGGDGGSTGQGTVNPGQKAVHPVQRAVHHHPLAHATMRAIEAAADRDRRRWPLLDPLLPGAMSDLDPLSDLEPQPPGSRSARPEADEEVSGPAAADVHEPQSLEGGDLPAGKRPRLSSRGEEATATEEDGPAANAAPGSALGSKLSAAATRDEAAASAGGCSGGKAGLGDGSPPSLSLSHAARPYMCTGYDAFLVQEPCIMCAMVRGWGRLDGRPRPLAPKAENGYIKCAMMRIDRGAGTTSVKGTSEARAVCTRGVLPSSETTCSPMIFHASLAGAWCAAAPSYCPHAPHAGPGARPGGARGVLLA